MKNIFLMETRLKPLLLICMLMLWLGRMANAQTYTLQNVLDSIVKRNPGLQQFALKTKSGISMSRASKAWMAPLAGLGLDEFPYGSVHDMNGMIPRKMMMLRLEQMLPNFAKQKAASKYYGSFALQNRDDLSTMKNMLFAKAKSAYYATLISAKKQDIINGQEKQLQFLIRIAEGRLAYGKGDLPTVYQARAQLSELQSQRIRVQSMAEQGIATMNILMNRLPDDPLRIDTSIILQYEVPVLRADSLYVVTHRSDIMRMAHEIKSMKLKQEMAASMNKPTFGITWDNMRMGNNTYMYNLMAMVSIPIVPWSSKGYKSEVRALDYEIQAMRKKKENETLQVAGSIRKAWLELQARQRSLDAFRTEIIPAYRKTYEANLNAFSENTGDIYKTLMAWEALSMKKMEYMDKLGEMLDQKAMLEMELQQNHEAENSLQ